MIHGSQAHRVHRARLSEPATIVSSPTWSTTNGAIGAGRVAGGEYEKQRGNEDDQASIGLFSYGNFDFRRQQAFAQPPLHNKEI